MLGVLDDLNTLLITQNFQDVQILTNVLRGDISLVVKEKMEDVFNFSSFTIVLYVITQLLPINSCKGKRNI